MTGKGTGTTAKAAEQEQTVVIIRDFQPGQLVHVIFITTDEAKQLPAIPPNAVQIAVFPAGGLQS